MAKLDIKVLRFEDGPQRPELVTQFLVRLPKGTAERLVQMEREGLPGITETIFSLKGENIYHVTHMTLYDDDGHLLWGCAM